MSGPNQPPIAQIMQSLPPGALQQILPMLTGGGQQASSAPRGQAPPMQAPATPPPTPNPGPPPGAAMAQVLQSRMQQPSGMQQPTV
jgi:hypothetical protein